VKGIALKSGWKRKDFIKTLGLGSAALVLGSCRQSQLSARERPNVLLIMTDDQGWGDIRSHGNDLIDTPVMDALAASGVRFERFFVSPVCAPTRACLLTGRYNLRTGAHGVTRGRENMRSSEVTLAEVFKSAGYVTGCFGKWHNGAHYPMDPNGQGFDEFLGFCAGHWNNYFDTTLQHNGKLVKSKGYITDVLTDGAIDFIRENRNNPFFCYVPYNAPHTPWQAPDKYYEKYKARGLDDQTACSYGMSECIDDNMGRLLKTLDDHGLAEDTIVLFLTDNGPNTDRYNGGMRGRKGSVHEGGVRVPLFIRWPGHIRPGARVDRIAAHIDLLPTLVELCGLPKPDTLPLDGHSVVPLISGNTSQWADRKIITPRGDGSRQRMSVRTQRWRAVMDGKDWELYDMVADPSQTRDVAARRPQVVAELSGAYAAWFKDVSKAGFDPIPIPIGYPERSEVVLPGHEAYLQPAAGAGISYNGRAGWANDWVDNWTDMEAYPYWEIDVVRPGTYEITLMYTCAAEDVGANIRVDVGGQSITGTVDKAHDPDQLPSPDRIPRKEVYEKVWAPLRLGIVTLPKGRTRLVVRGLTKPGSTVMDLKAVHVRRVGA